MEIFYFPHYFYIYELEFLNKKVFLLPHLFIQSFIYISVDSWIFIVLFHLKFNIIMYFLSHIVIYFAITYSFRLTSVCFFFSGCNLHIIYNISRM